MFYLLKIGYSRRVEIIASGKKKDLLSKYLLEDLPRGFICCTAEFAGRIFNIGEAKGPMKRRDINIHEYQENFLKTVSELEEITINEMIREGIDLFIEQYTPSESVMLTKQTEGIGLS